MQDDSVQSADAVEPEQEVESANEVGSAHASQVRLPFRPPVLMWGLVGIGICIEQFLPSPIDLHLLVRVGLGILTMFGGAMLMRASGRAFGSHDEVFSHGAKTAVLVTDGVFARSRNPVYVGATMMMLGLGLLADSSWVLLIVFGIGVPLLHFGVILPEEQYLTETFGDEYAAYRKKVRRWL
jgi:protein-S-isoprenylcysteine O-methyltransferase Ste14